MAKVKFTAVVADMRGKLAGSVFSKNRGGAYVRTKVSPVNAQTAAQSQARSRLTGLTQGWRSLSAAERTAWNDATPNFPRTNQFGDQVILSGQTLFIGLNSNLITVGEAEISDPPTPQSVYAITTGSLAMAKGAGTATIAFSVSPVPADNAVLVFMTTGMSPGRDFAKNMFRLVTTMAAAAVTPLNVAAAYTAKFGSIPTAGQKVFVKLVPVNTVSGQQGQAFVFSAIVAA